MPEVSTKDLLPYANNARTHSAEQIKQVAASIKEFGFTNPILIDENNVIIAGHGRLEAAKSLGMETVPVRILDNLTDDQKKAYVIADNQLALNAGWDIELLKIELEELKLNDFDLALTGFDDDFISGLLHKDTEGLTDEDAVPEPPEDPVSVLGDLWILGNHRLLCGDSTSIDAVEKLMDGQKADMVFTDPPYNVEYEGNYIQSGEILKKEDKVWSGGIKNDNLEDFSEWLRSAFMTADCVMNEGCSIYVWHPSGKAAADFWTAWPFDAWHFQVDLIWNKLSLIIGRWDYKPQHEPCMYGWKGKNRSWTGPNNLSTVWDYARQQGRSGEKREHPTQKPVFLADRAIKNHSVGIILDVFGGSGSTMIACETNNRISRTMELDPKYCDVIVKRWQDFTGQEAVHETGKTFNAMKNHQEAA